MWGTCKIVNFSWLLFSTLVIGQNLFTQKNTLSKWSVNAFYCFVVYLQVSFRKLKVCFLDFRAENKSHAHYKTHLHTVKAYNTRSSQFC